MKGGSSKEVNAGFRWLGWVFALDLARLVPMIGRCVRHFSAHGDVSFLGKSRCTCRPADLMYSYSTARCHQFCKLYHTSSFMCRYSRITAGFRNSVNQVFLRTRCSAVGQ